MQVAMARKKNKVGIGRAEPGDEEKRTAEDTTPRQFCTLDGDEK